MTILFVCSGNTCRSPLAVAAWRALDGEEAPQSETLSENVGARANAIEVASAGLAASRGSAATRYAQQIAQGWKADLAGHRSRLLRQSLVRESDLIVTMTQEQAQSVRAQFGLPSHRVRVLGEFADNRVLDDGTSLSARSEERRLAALLNEEADVNDHADDIEDPFGASLEAYESCAARIRLCVKGLRRALREGEVAL